MLPVYGLYFCCKIVANHGNTQLQSTLQRHTIVILLLVLYCLRAWGLRNKTWGLSDLDPYLIANLIREFLKLESKAYYPL